MRSSKIILSILGILGVGALAQEVSPQSPAENKRT
jgi:hypothetical protein